MVGWAQPYGVFPSPSHAAFIVSRKMDPFQNIQEVLRDPEGREASSIHKHLNLKDKLVIEVGCGDGRMTWQYASSPRAIHGVDPDHERLQNAIKDRPNSINAATSFVVSEAQSIPFARQRFDCAILAWSL